MTGLFSPVAQNVKAAENDIFTSYKLSDNRGGWIETDYKVLADNTVQYGDGKKAASNTDVKYIGISKVVTNFKAWETIETHTVSHIAANAFLGCEEIKLIIIEGDVTIDEQAFNGLPETTIFSTYSVETKKALLQSGIPIERIKYESPKKKYVVFGASIAAGYALPEYDNYPAKDQMLNDRYPVPQSAFSSIVSQAINENPENHPAVLEDQAVSGWTSEQFLEQLQKGNYKSTLEASRIVSVTIGANDLLGAFKEILNQSIVNLQGDLQQLVLILSKTEPLDAEDIVQRDKLVLNIKTNLSMLNENLTDNPMLNEACEAFKQETQPQIIAEINKQAPQAQIYFTNFYNPLYGQVFNLSALMPQFAAVYPDIFNQFETIDLGAISVNYIEKMNSAFDVNTVGYEKVDIYEVFNTLGLVNVNLSSSTGISGINLDPHPNVEGHKVIGGILSKAILDGYKPLEPIADVSNEKAIQSFGLAGRQGTIDPTNKQIQVTVPYNTNLDGQVATFTLSPKAQAFVDDKVQVSGETSNNFTNPFTYTVMAEDGTLQAYTLTVTKEEAPQNKDPEAPANKKNETPTNKTTGKASVKTGIESQATQAGAAVVILSLIALTGLVVYKRR